MSVRKVGDFPTRRLDATELARYARDADACARLGIEPDPAATSRLAEEDAAAAAAAADGPEIDVSVDFEPDSGPPATPPPGAHSESEVRITQRARAPALDAIPVIVVSRDDLAWFVHDEAQPVLERIDGKRTVSDILRAVTIPAAEALFILRELEEQHVIELSSPP